MIDKFETQPVLNVHLHLPHRCLHLLLDFMVNVNKHFSVKSVLFNIFSGKQLMKTIIVLYNSIFFF